MSKPKVRVGVATSGMISSEWWSKITPKLMQEIHRGIDFVDVIAVKSAVPDHNKNNIIGGGVAPIEEKDRNSKTDANRSTIVGVDVNNKYLKDGFMANDAEWLMWLDDDTVPPDGFVSHLLNLGRTFVAGLYFLPQEPFNPLAYLRREDGLYHAFYNWAPGTLVPVDSVGMGCTLIHKSVFQDVMDNHTVYMRPNGSLFPIHNEKVKNERQPLDPGEEYVKDGVLHQPIKKVEPDDNRVWPFYAMEYGRTEDHHFCEMASAVGHRPWVDTNILCEHYKLRPVTYKHYTEELPKQMEQYESRAGQAG